MPDFANPDLMLGMEKAFSKGTRNTQENSLLLTTKIFMVNDNTRTYLEKWSLSDLNTATSSGCRAWVVCGGKQNNMISLYRHKSTTSKVMCDL